jgi:hypothetical protein
MTGLKLLSLKHLLIYYMRNLIVLIILIYKIWELIISFNHLLIYI